MSTLRRVQECDEKAVTTRALEQVQICNCSGSGTLFYYKVAPAPELLDTTALAPLVENLSSSMFVQFEVSSC